MYDKYIIASLFPCLTHKEIAEVISDYKATVLDTIQDAMSFETNLDKPLSAKVIIEGDVWDYVQLIDSNGDEWYTEDQGKTWLRLNMRQ